MRKVFISSISMQKVNAFKYDSGVYPENNPTAFPITISLKNNCQPGDEVAFITIVTHSEGNLAVENYHKFCEQAGSICREKGARAEFIELAVPARIEAASPRRLYKEIVAKLQDNDEIYADITYGFKYNPIVIFAALNNAYQVRENVDIKEICYGNLYNGSAEIKPEYFDVTSLFYLNSLSGLMGVEGMMGDGGNGLL